MMQTGAVPVSSAPHPLHLYHFTHIDHLPTVIARGLLPDNRVPRSDLLHEAGHRPIKLRRRGAAVTDGPGGFVADYVPFYFAPKSPMLYVVWKGRVSTYSGTSHDLVHLYTTAADLQQHGCELVVSDRNASKTVARFSADPGAWGQLVDWSLMDVDVWWANTPDDPERMERRMAECLAHPSVPWAAIRAVGVRDPARGAAVRSVLAAAGSTTRVFVKPRWYYP